MWHQTRRRSKIVSPLEKKKKKKKKIRVCSRPTPRTRRLAPIRAVAWNAAPNCPPATRAPRPSRRPASQRPWRRGTRWISIFLSSIRCRRRRRHLENPSPPPSAPSSWSFCFVLFFLVWPAWTQLEQMHLLCFCSVRTMARKTLPNARWPTLTSDASNSTKRCVIVVRFVFIDSGSIE
jgi:hypothetical protein